MARQSKWYGKKAKDLIKKTAVAALYEEAELILSASIDEAPIDTGTLRRSGTVTPAPKEDSVYISYNTPYAVAVHEGYGPRDITVDTKKILAVPTKRWKGGPVNPYESKAFPKYSKDGSFVLLGRRVRHPGFKGVKYLENPFNRMKGDAMKRVGDKVRKALQETK